VIPVGLEEALKIRVISKGPGVTYYLMRPWQKYMWKKLKNHKIFKLIGEPVNEKILLDTLGRQINAKKRNKYYLSIDYEAATDNLKSIISTTVANTLCDMFELPNTSVIREAFVDSLVNHYFEELTEVLDNGEVRKYYSLQEFLSYKENKIYKENAVLLSDIAQILPARFSFKLRQQINGQLMGSITSFPILCIANAAVCRWAKEIETGKPTLLKDLPLLINGDDAVMTTNKIGDLAWQRISAFAGLKPSLGKVQRSFDYLNINSTLYSCRPFEYRLIKYVNMGLVNGMTRSGQQSTKFDTFVDSNASLGAKHRELKRLTPEELWPQVSKRFIKKNRKVLDDLHVPWFIPEHLGGVGLIGEPSYKDRVIARAIINKMIKGCPQPIVIKDDTNTDVHSTAVSTYMLNLPKTITRDKLNCAQERISYLYCAAAFYYPEKIISTVEDSAAKALKRNRMIWKKYLHNYNLFGGLRPFEKEIITLSDDLTPTGVTQTVYEPIENFRRKLYIDLI